MANNPTIINPTDPALLGNVVTDVPVLAPGSLIANGTQQVVQTTTDQTGLTLNSIIQEGTNVYVTNINEINQQTFANYGAIDGVTSITANGGLDLSSSTGDVVICNTGVTCVTSGVGISLSANAGPVTVCNTGVTCLVAGSNIALNAGTGCILISATQGTSGFSGAVGAPGPTGPEGASGASGISGATGPAGPTGATGAPGPTGAAGESGFSGASGSSGQIGVTGQSGFSGLSGAIGPAGPTGPSGPQGVSGFSGAAGAAGAPGPAGATGPTGPTGPEGASGLSGFSGQIGVTGASGFSGQSGFAGDRYATSSTTSLTISTGSKTLTVGTGLAYTLGQTIIIAYDVSNYMEGVVLSYNTGTGELSAIVGSITGSGTYASWGVNLAGTPGATGASGTSGFSGAAGTPGSAGAVGASGTSGFSGSNGTSGFSGASGQIGGPTYNVTNSGSTSYTINGASNPAISLIRGFTYYFSVVATGHPFWIKTAQVTGTGSAYNSGVTNNGTDSGVITFTVPLDAPATLYYICQFHASMTGVFSVTDAGVSGASGFSGAVGAPGPTGASGVSGFSGVTGPTGPTGPAGPTGPTGPTGESGVSGFSGAAFVGSSGFSGVSGAAGASGISGFSGTAGASGISGFSGSGGTNVALFEYSANTGFTSGNPSSGYLLWNNSTQTSATSLNVSRITNDGIDIQMFLQLLQQTESLTLQDKSNSNNYQTWLVSGAPVDNNPYWTIPVTLVTSGGTGTTNFPPNQELVLTLINGISGYSGSSGFSGATGPAGTSGFSGATGPTGTSGYSGEVGASGVSGFTGVSGFSGEAFVGSSGYSGQSGVSGFTGVSGFSGEVGASGVSGYSGSGTSGYSGGSGTSGFSGVTPSSSTLVGNGLDPDALGWRIVPQNSQSADYTLIASDSGKHILHPAADANARTFTIPANGSVAYPVGTALTFVNETSNAVTIAINSDTMYLAGTGTTGSRTLAQYGVATALKITSTSWYISGSGLT